MTRHGPDEMDGWRGSSRLRTVCARACVEGSSAEMKPRGLKSENIQRERLEGPGQPRQGLRGHMKDLALYAKGDGRLLKRRGVNEQICVLRTLSGKQPEGRLE